VPDRGRAAAEGRGQGAVGGGRETRQPVGGRVA